MASLGGDRALLIGGSAVFCGDTWVYDLSDNTWTDKAPDGAPSGRYDHAMASLGADQVLLFGGHTGNINGETWLAAGFQGEIIHQVYLPLLMRNRY
jgi:hypothetical protein